MESMESVQAILRQRGDVNLSGLLEGAHVEFEGTGQFGSLRYSDLTTAEIYAPFADYEALRSLPPAECDRILEAMLELWPPREHGMELNEVVFRVDRGSLDSWAGTVAFEGPTGWALVDRQMQGVRRKLASAATEEDFQAVGLVCRETLISVAQAVFDPELHTASDVRRISETDTKGMLDAYLSVALRGRSSEAARKYAKAAVDLANGLQHRRSAMFRDAAMCAEATASVVGFIAAAAGRRSPASKEGGSKTRAGSSANG
ncbi:MAG: hypothetical protein F4W96_09755 [Chloroflexi bacterium]|nr:hypothetical protein [Chloroflexota bacterium]